jgi:hypothetical protein
LHGIGLNGQWFDNTKLQSVAPRHKKRTNELRENISELWATKDGRWSMIDGRWSMVDQSEIPEQQPDISD